MRAIFEAACQVRRRQRGHPNHGSAGFHPEELHHQAELIHEVARQAMNEHGMTIDYTVGTMIELPRAA